MPTMDMTKVADAVPSSLEEARSNWPRRKQYTPSPKDWRDEVFYFLLPDRFSDGQEAGRPMLPSDLSTPEGVARIQGLRGGNWRWDQWLSSGQSRYQGGTLKGIQSKLGYLSDLGVTTLWIGPIFRQRVEEDSYHGYGIQNFFDVDPRFGTRQDLVELVDAIHAKGMRVVLDIIFNHAGCNWLYDASTGNMVSPVYLPGGSYSPLWPKNGFGAPIYDPKVSFGKDDFLWPRELQSRGSFVGAGSGSLADNQIDDPFAEHKRTDFCSLRKLNLYDGEVLGALIAIYAYWIALVDIDGFRVDTLKHVSMEQARAFCGALKECAESLGKDDLFIVGEVAGGDGNEDRYLDILGRNMDACLDIGSQRERLCGVAHGVEGPGGFFQAFDAWDPGMGSHRNWGSQHLTILNDHDHVFGPKIRFAADAPNDHQAAAAIALQVFTLGIPCLYYGTEQGLASGAEPQERCWLPWGSSDALLREAMFGPEHPRASGWSGTQGDWDENLPGFGPHGTCGYHAFDPDHPVYRRASRILKLFQQEIALRRGRQYLRELSRGEGFQWPTGGGLLAWSRVFHDREILVVVNTDGCRSLGADVTVDRNLSAGELRVLLCTDPSGVLLEGQPVPTVLQDGRRCVRVPLLGPSEVLVLSNH